MDAATYSFADKVAIVTGATSGIGKATAQALARAGARVVVSGINEALGSRVVEEITRDDGTAVFIRADVSRREDVEPHRCQIGGASGNAAHDRFVDRDRRVGLILLHRFVTLHCWLV